ncbi:MAG TPA: cytochrome C oxidase subunit IV family protein [Edaphocola sp.]|nr:cytochrome C oxidase subunit IV family protein [Edaphocola sp.]
MSHEHNTEEMVELYEGDQSKLYSGVLNHHKDIHSQESKTQVKRIVRIMIYLAIVTSLEVTLGLWDHHMEVFNKGILNAIFLIMTLLKAYLIVDVFMHLGNEIRNFIMAILIPLLFLVWAIIAFAGDGHHWLHMNNTRANTIEMKAEQPK